MVTPSTVRNLMASAFPCARTAETSKVGTINTARNDLAIPIGEPPRQKILPPIDHKTFSEAGQVATARARLFFLARKAGRRLGNAALGRPRPQSDRYDLGPGHDDAGDGAVPLLNLGEIETQESMQVEVRLGCQVSSGQIGHVPVIGALAGRMQLAASHMPAQITVAGRVQVIQFVKQRDELVGEILIQKA